MVIELRDWSKSIGGWAGAERGGSSGFEPCARGGSCNFQLPLGGGSPYFLLTTKETVDYTVLLYKTQPTGIIAKILTNLLCEKIQRLTGRTSIRAWNPLLTFFFLALTSMSFNDFPFCKEMIGGSLKIY